MNIHDRTGHAYANGEEILEVDPWLAGAYRDWINAGYWLLMPYKLKDSGVTLGYKGETTLANGQEAHILTLKFDSVGLTPRNLYDIFVNKESGLVDQWSYYPNEASDEPAFITTWDGYKEYDGILIADNRTYLTSSRVWEITNLGVYSELSDAVFENPEPISLNLLAESGTH